MRMQRRTLLTIIILSLAFTGCSNQFVYDRIDRLAQFYIERYVDLDKDQSSLLYVNLAAIKEWHRQDELASYLKFLGRIETDIQADISAATVASWVEQLRLSYAQIRDKVVPALVQLAQTLTTAQIEEFAANMEERNRELEQEYLTRDETEYRESVFEGIEDRLDEWLGRLTPEQQQTLHQAVSKLERLDRQWLDNRRVWQQRINAELARQPGWQARLTALVTSRSDYAQQDDIDADSRNEQRIYAAIAAVLNMRTDRQQRKLTQQLSQWQRDLEALQNSGPNRVKNNMSGTSTRIGL